MRFAAGNWTSWVHNLRSRTLSSAAVRTIVGGGLQLTLSSAVGQVLGLLGSILIARTLGQSQFGAYGILASTTLMAGSLAGGSLHVTALKFIAQFQETAPKRAASIYRLCYLSSLVFGGLAAVAILLFAEPLAGYMGDPCLVVPFRITALAIPLTAINSVQAGRILAHKRVRALAIVNALQSVLQLLILPAAAFAGSIRGLAFGVLFLAILTTLLHAEALRRVAGSSWAAYGLAESVSEWSVLPRFALPHLLGATISTPAQWWPLMLLSHQAGGLEQVAVFTAAQKWRQLVLFLPSVVSKPSIPLLAESFGQNDYSRAGRLVALAFLFNIVVTAPVVLGLVLVSGPLIGLFGNDYRTTGVATMRLVICAAFLQACLVPLGDALATAGRNWNALGGGLIRAALLVSVATFLVNKGHGAVGVACAHIASTIAMLLFQAVVLAWVFRYRKAA